MDEIRHLVELTRGTSLEGYVQREVVQEHNELQDYLAELKTGATVIEAGAEMGIAPNNHDEMVKWVSEKIGGKDLTQAIFSTAYSRLTNDDLEALIRLVVAEPDFGPASCDRWYVYYLAHTYLDRASARVAKISFDTLAVVLDPHQTDVGVRARRAPGLVYNFFIKRAYRMSGEAIALITAFVSFCQPKGE